MSETDYVPVVRPYTAEERKAIIPGDNESEWDKLCRRQATRAIDEIRYREAMEVHPDMAGHFQRLINLGYEAVLAWESSFIDSVRPADTTDSISAITALPSLDIVAAMETG